jgi:kynurenine formamidase
MKGLPVHMMSEKESISTIPAEFLIDEKGIIKKVHYATKLNDQLSVDVIKAFADTGKFI